MGYSSLGQAERVLKRLDEKNPFSKYIAKNVFPPDIYKTFTLV